MIYKRYLFQEISKLFFLFLSAALLLLFLFDTSTHLNTFRHPGLPLWHILMYELTQVLKLFNHLVFFVLLISVLTLYTSLNRYREWIILTTCGLPKRKIVHPILGFATCIMLGLYAYNQWIAPYAHTWNHTFQESYLKQTLPPAVFAFTSPEDGSEFIYAHYDSASHTLEDVYWLRDASTIWHFKQLSLSTHTGHYVDQLTKDNKGWKIHQSHTVVPGIKLTWDLNMLRKKLLPLPSQSLWQLLSQINCSFYKLPDRTAKATAYALQELTLPMACLFVAVLPASFCLRFSRQAPIYMLFFWTLLGGICYLVMVSTSCILGSNQLVAPVLALCLPPVLLTICTVWSYARLH